MRSQSSVVTVKKLNIPVPVGLTRVRNRQFESVLCVRARVSVCFTALPIAWLCLSFLYPQQRDEGPTYPVIASMIGEFSWLYSYDLV